MMGGQVKELVDTIRFGRQHHRHSPALMQVAMEVHARSSSTYRFLTGVTPMPPARAVHEWKNGKAAGTGTNYLFLVNAFEKLQVSAASR